MTSLSSWKQSLFDLPVGHNVPSILPHHPLSSIFPFGGQAIWSSPFEEIVRPTRGVDTNGNIRK